MDAEVAVAEEEEGPLPTPLCLANFFHFLTNVFALTATLASGLVLNFETAAPTNVPAKILTSMEHLSRCDKMSKICSVSLLSLLSWYLRRDSFRSFTRLDAMDAIVEMMFDEMSTLCFGIQ